MKLHLKPLTSGACIALICFSQHAMANNSLADKSLAQVKNAPSVVYQAPQAPTTLSVAPSKIEKIVTKVQHISQGAGVLGKNIKTVIKKNEVGIQYSTQW